VRKLFLPYRLPLALQFGAASFSYILSPIYQLERKSSGSSFIFPFEKGEMLRYARQGNTHLIDFMRKEIIILLKLIVGGNLSNV